MVLVFTGNANNSNEIKKELALASQNNLMVIPVRIEDVTPNEAFAYEFATRQWIDLFEDWEKSITKLVELIAVALDDHSLGDPAKAGSGLADGASAPSFSAHPQLSHADADRTNGKSRYWSKVLAVTFSGGLVLFGVLFGVAWWLWVAKARNLAAVNVPPQLAGLPNVNEQHSNGNTTANSNSQSAARNPADELPGSYRIEGVNPDGSNYGGLVTITADGDVYNFRWKISSSQTYFGSGRLRGRIITVDWGQQYPVIYRVNDDGTLRGTWANGIASEVLLPIR